MRAGALFFFSVIMLVSCGKSDLLSEMQSIPGQEWDSKKKISFEADIKDTLKRHDIFIDFRHNDNYPYSEIYFLFDIDFPNGKNSRDTVYYMIQAPDGKWLGRNSGSMVDYHMLIQNKRNIVFPVKGKYKFHISHLMRDEKLAGIEDVGICITPKD